MIANDKETPFEIAVKMITAPIWVPIYFVGVGVMKLRKAWSSRKAKAVEPEVLTPVQPTWMPSKEFERAVYAALILAGEPVNNRRLAELMDCSPGEASRRVAQLEGVIRKARKGREVLISLH
jgi:hypothetical protein